MTPSFRAATVVAAAAVGLAVVGFFTGIAHEARPRLSVDGAGESNVAVSTPAPGYKDLRESTRGPNANVSKQAFFALEATVPSTFGDAGLSAEESTQRRERRRELRAYEGSPPVIPHRVVPGGVPECLTCHEKGIVIEGKRATPMTHDRRDNCMQCHVPAGGPR